jgi:hypothetical protein
MDIIRIRSLISTGNRSRKENMIPKKLPILLVVAFLFLAGVSGPVSGYSISEGRYQRVSSCYTDDLIAGYGNVPVYGPDGTVTHTGVMETIPDEKAMLHWRYEMYEIYNHTRFDMKAYYFPDGPVISYGSDLLGTICVGIWKEADTVRTTRDDIYAIIDAEARSRGIEDVPVIFIRESIPDTRPLLIPDPNVTAFIRPIQEVAIGYPVYTPQTNEKQPPSAGITHSSVAFLIEKITPGYWPPCTSSEIRM